MTELYRAIHDTLSRGGVLLNLDAAVSEDTRLNALVFDRWAGRMSEHGITDAQARAHSAAWADENHYLPLDAELNRSTRRASTRSSASGDADRPRSSVRCAQADCCDLTNAFRERPTEAVELVSAPDT
jgi:hypothetical protein